VLLDVDAAAQQAAEIDPRLVLDGATPRLLDEWQIVPAIWNHVRREVDLRGQPGQFLLTGSATPADDTTRHTGGLRFGRVQMRPMSLAEVGRSTGEISLAALLAGAATRSTDPGLGVPDLIEEVVRGGWPASGICRSMMPLARCATTWIASAAPISRRSTASAAIPSASRRSYEGSPGTSA
jgi:hypothetical protein